MQQSADRSALDQQRRVLPAKNNSRYQVRHLLPLRREGKNMGFTFWVELGKEDCRLTDPWGRNSRLRQPL